MEDEGGVCDGDEEGLGGVGVRCRHGVIVSRGGARRQEQRGRNGEKGVKREPAASSSSPTSSAASAWRTSRRARAIFSSTSTTPFIRPPPWPPRAASTGSTCSAASGWKWHTLPSREAFEGFQRVTFLDSRFHSPHFPGTTPTAPPAAHPPLLRASSSPILSATGSPASPSSSPASTPPTTTAPAAGTPTPGTSRPSGTAAAASSPSRPAIPDTPKKQESGAARSSPPDWAGSPARRNCKKRPANLQNQTDFSNLSLPFFLTWIVAVQGKILVFEKGDCMVLLDKGKMTIKKKLIALENSDSR